MVDISAEELIPLVRQRPVIWDKSSDNFKDKALKTAAWREICCVFKPDFDKLEENEMKEFAKSVNIKWVYIRDAFLRSQKKQMRSGSVKKPKPYVYTNLLSFLNVNEPGTRHESESQSNYTDSSSDEDAPPEKRFQPPPAKKMRIENVRTIDEKMSPFFNSRLSDQDEHTEHPHISFMKGVLPSLATFDDDENLEFQAGVVELIQKIRRKRQAHDAYPYDIKIFET